MMSRRVLLLMCAVALALCCFARKPLHRVLVPVVNSPPPPTNRSPVVAIEPVVDRDLFSGLGNPSLGNVLLVRELLSQIWARHRLNTTPRVCLETEHSLVLPGGRDVPADTPVGTVRSVFGDGVRYHVRSVDCDVVRGGFDLVVQYSATNVKNFELSGRFDKHTLARIVYVPALQFDYIPGAPRADHSIITTFVVPEEPRRREFAAAMAGVAGIQNYRDITDPADMMRLYDRSAILLNVHQTPHHHTLEEFRVLPALLRGVVVISEVVPLVEHVPFRDYVVWTTLADFPATTRYVLQHYEEYHRRFFGSEGGLGAVLTGMRVEALAGLERQVIKSYGLSTSSRAPR